MDTRTRIQGNDRGDRFNVALAMKTNTTSAFVMTVLCTCAAPQFATVFSQPSWPKFQCAGVDRPDVSYVVRPHSSPAHIRIGLAPAGYRSASITTVQITPYRVRSTTDPVYLDLVDRLRLYKTACLLARYILDNLQIDSLAQGARLRRPSTQHGACPDIAFGAL